MEATLSRRERERKMRRDAMLEAALSVFAEKGYARATLEEIAQRAEFGKGTLYNYFEDGKQGMLYAIFDEIFDGLVQLVEESFDSGCTANRPIRDCMHSFIARCMQYFEDRREVFMLVMKESYRMLLSEDAERAAYFKAQQHRVVKALIPHFDRAMQLEQIRRFSPEAIAHTLFGNINGIQMHLCLHDEKETMTPATAADFLTTLLMDGLILGDETHESNGTKQHHDPA